MLKLGLEEKSMKVWVLDERAIAVLPKDTRFHLGSDIIWTIDAREWMHSVRKYS